MLLELLLLIRHPNKEQFDGDKHLFFLIFKGNEYFEMGWHATLIFEGNEY